MSEKLDYGQEISLVDANKIIKEHQDLDKILKKSVEESKIPSTHYKTEEKKKALIKRAEEFVKREKNTFIFDKELITRFFFNEQNSLNAEYLVVVLGAHPEDMSSTDDFKKGSFTVVTAGCVGYIDSKNEFALRTLNHLEKPANEYPPRITTTELVSQVDPIDNNVIDTFIKFNIV